jgi:hypothetical protein
MHFKVTHTFSATVQAVEAGTTDPAFYQQLQLPDVAAIEVQERRVDDTATTLRVRFVYGGQLDSIARRVVGSQQLSWIQTIAVDTERHGGGLDAVAESRPDRLTAKATFTLVADGERTVRRLEGDLRVRFPVVGGRAEQRIVPGLLRRLDLEAAALDEWLRTTDTP